jgi:hypothetical protein
MCLQFESLYYEYTEVMKNIIINILFIFIDIIIRKNVKL